MKLIIDIDESIYHRFINGFANEDDAYLIEQLFKNGTPYEEKSQNEWSPVSAQEPDVGGIYYVTAKDTNGHIGIDIARRISKDVWTFGGEKLSGVEIIAWQPLPESYKGLENEYNQHLWDTL